MRVLMRHVHGSWATSFVHGPQTTLVPVVPDRGPDGRGRPETFHSPDRAVEVPPERLRDEDVDVVVLQRPHKLRLAEQRLGRRPGRDAPAVYVEHDTPRRTPSDAGAPDEVVPDSQHFLQDRSDIPVVHVTHFNRLFWNCGRAPVTVIEHGVAGPGYRYTADMPRGRSRTSRRRGCTRSSPAAWARRRGPAVVFDDDIPAPLLKRLRPDVWVKGADYAGTIPPEAETVRAYEGRSTTRLLSTTKGNAS